MITDGMLQHVPGCENGDAPFSQELIGGGKVNRSFLVRTRRGRFVVRLNESAESDPGLDRVRERVLHTAAAAAGIAPAIIYASPDHSCFITDYVEGRSWTPHYFTRMRDLRALGLRLAMLHALSPPAMARFDPMVTARRYAETIIRGDPGEMDRIGNLLERGDQAFERSGSRRRQACIVHSDLHHGNVLTADRIYFIDWEYAHLGDPLFDLACIIGYYPRAVTHGELLLKASGLDAQGATEVELTELTRVFNLLTFLWYRARRLTRSVTATDLQLEATALRRMLTLAPGT
ncbi:MAG TPA: phosphotransferase [Steroidobacteraceae bacterium]|nr:phosphotransferase [Steroidobacteraceae bacterium]